MLHWPELISFAGIRECLKNRRDNPGRTNHYRLPFPFHARSASSRVSETGKNRGLTTAATSDVELLWSSQTLPPKFTSSTFCSSRLTHPFGGVCTCAVTAASPRCTSCSRSHSIGRLERLS